MAWLVGAGHFSHVGGAEAFYLASAGETGWGRALRDLVLPSLLGTSGESG